MDRPVIRYLFGQEPRAWVKIQTPLADTTTEDLAAIVGLAPLGLKIGMKQVYAMFNIDPPADGDSCLTPPVVAAPAGSPDENGARRSSPLPVPVREGRAPRVP